MEKRITGIQLYLVCGSKDWSVSFTNLINVRNLWDDEEGEKSTTSFGSVIHIDNQFSEWFDNLISNNFWKYSAKSIITKMILASFNLSRNLNLGLIEYLIDTFFDKFQNISTILWMLYGTRAFKKSIVYYIKINRFLALSPIKNIYRIF